MPEAPLEPDDAGILAAARDGDHEAGALLVKRYGPSMLRTAWNVTGRYSGTDPEDAVQEAFVAALTTAALPTGDIGAWLRAITARKALDALRQTARRGERPLGEPGENLPNPVPMAPARVPLDVLSVRRALATLSPPDRAVLTLVDMEGYSMSEAASLLGSTTMAVKWRAVRARKRLRAALEGRSGPDKERRG